MSNVKVMNDICIRHIRAVGLGMVDRSNSLMSVDRYSWRILHFQMQAFALGQFWPLTEVDRPSIFRSGALRHIAVHHN